ncbi:MAG: UDP-N-acetylmuramate--L-alanine ligase [Candidatus Caenarcaniphilales bacterium]|nr:UDP-N-acetylmuramate--L-alanine ligase [Candidatus Caenarcaniphilales bacterium]
MDSQQLKSHLKLPSSIHFIGVGGAGMNPLAGICLKNGVKVTGSDNSHNKNQEELRSLGGDIWIGHSELELKNRELPEACVFSTAINPSNEEYVYLKNKGVKLWHRSDLLQEIAKQFEKQIVISGTHGKTSTTALVIWILQKAGLNPCWVLGGVLNGLGSYGWNDYQREIFVFEGDESDQSFLKSTPFIGLITSIEADHLENYDNSFAVQISKFIEFIEKSEKTVFAYPSAEELLNYSDPLLDHPWLSKALRKKQSISYGLRSEQISLDFSVTFKDENSLIFISDSEENAIKIPPINNAPGKHNCLNAIAAIACAKQLGIEAKDAVKLLNDFPGIYRRFEFVGETKNGISIVDDYAHHPSEVKAAISAGKEYLNQKQLGLNEKKGKLIVLFQPHLPTRLRDQWSGFLSCFDEADTVFLNDLYIARGEPIPGIDSANLAKQINHKDLTYVGGSPENLINPVSAIAENNDLILILGAGNITYIRETLLTNLRLN